MKGFHTPILSLSADTANQTMIKIKSLGLLVKQSWMVLWPPERWGEGTRKRYGWSLHLIFFPFLFFFHDRMLSFTKCFFFFFWNNHKVFVFHSVGTVCYIFYLCILSHPCISIINTTWSWCILFLICWIWVASTLLKILIAMIIRDFGLWIPFLKVFLWGFDARIEQLWKGFLSFSSLD